MEADAPSPSASAPAPSPVSASEKAAAAARIADEPDIFEAAKWGNLDLVKDHVTAEPGCVHKTTNGGSNYTALHICCERGHLDVCKFLVESRANIEAEDSSYTGGTPFHASCIGGDFDVFAFLVESGANINAKSSKENWTALHHCCFGHAKKAGRIDICKALLRFKADIEATTSDLYNTPTYTSIPIAHVTPAPF